jgi:FtsP/CotA-like multicopper oxidase with cupredoxin domain
MIERDREEYEAFGCDVSNDEISTPDRVAPNARFDWEGPNGVDIRMPDGREVRFWNFEDKRDDRSKDKWPSKTMRVKQGQVVHSSLSAKKNTHTIHHHGMNTSTMNDGVGHVSFEVSGSYTYQFQPMHAGTYFYHCHKNTVLHFEMGMYGFLIVDPPTGRGTLYEGGPAYDVEALWALDDVDPSWRQIDHQAGLCGEDAGLDLFRPKYFMITGVPHPRTMTDSRARIKAKVGQTILIRHLNASYSVVSTRIEGLDATVYGFDGRPLQHPASPWATPIFIPAGTSFDTVSAQRFDLILKPTRIGVYPVRVEFRHWVTGEIHDGGRGICDTVIEVTA